MSRVFENPDHSKARTFFKRVLSFSGPRTAEASILAIVHLVDSAIPFIPAIDEKYPVLAFLGKPSSIQAHAQDHLAAALPLREYRLSKVAFRESPGDSLAEILRERGSAVAGSRLILLDIGGYFASRHAGIQGLQEIRDTAQHYGYSLAGIVEDTQNGHARYEAALQALDSEPDFLVYSVAHSPLKKPENHLVGVAITFSIEALLRKSNIVLQSRRAGVIGFGPIGRSVAHSLRNRGITVSICEIDSIRLAQAAAQGFKAYHYEHGFDDFASELNLVVSATGAGASGTRRPLNRDSIPKLRRGTFIASVTSQDDEIDLESIRLDYSPEPLKFNPDVSRWVRKSEISSQADRIPSLSMSSNSPSFYLMLYGNAVNFRDEGVIGPAIQLLQGEVIACIGKILVSSPSKMNTRQVHELSNAERKAVADAWLDQYLLDSAVSEME